MPVPNGKKNSLAKPGGKSQEAAPGRPRGQAQVQSLVKGLELLALYRPGRAVLTVSEMSRELDAPQSSVYRFVATLRDQGYLRKLPGGEGYALNTEVLRFGDIVRESSELQRLAPPVMRSLVAATGETVFLSLRSGNRGVVIDKVESSEMMRIIPAVGWSFPLHAGSTGKVLLAWEPEDYRSEYLQNNLEQATDNTIIDPESLERELAAVRKTGFALADEEYMVGGRTVAAPVFDAPEQIAASIGIAAPAIRLTHEDAHSLAPIVVEHAQRLSAELGARHEQVSPPR